MDDSAGDDLRAPYDEAPAPVDDAIERDAAVATVEPGTGLHVEGDAVVAEPEIDSVLTATPAAPEAREPTDASIASLHVPEGFALNVYARELGNARMLSTHGEHVYVTRPAQGDVLRLIDADGDGVAEGQATVLHNFTGVHGIAFYEDNVYVATPKSVYSMPVYADGSFGAPCGIMGSLPDDGQNPSRTVGIGPDGKLYISVLSEQATVLRADRDGANRSTFSSGAPSTVGFDWHPVTGALWGLDHGADWLDSQVEGDPIALTFYRGEAFPDAYQSSAFIALRGAWLDGAPEGFKIVRLVFDAQGEPTGFEDFVTGFASDDEAAYFGRPSGVTVAPDGALLFSDDEHGSIYRVQISE